MSRVKKPLRWIEEASPQEIGEALLAVDTVKSYKVAAYLAKRMGPESEGLIARAKKGFSEDPLGAIGRALIGASEN